MKRLAFYGRVSTEDQQDPDASRGWQLSRARQLVEPADCTIVDEFFDLGTSRSLPWKRRPEGARLLDALSNPDRGFDGVVIGEPQRAFYGNQFSLTFPVFTHYGVQLWVPEVGGPVDPGSEAGWAELEGHRSSPCSHAYPATNASCNVGSRFTYGPIPRRTAAVRLPPRRRGPSPKSWARGLRTASPSVGSGRGYGSGRKRHLRELCGGCRC